MFGGPSIKFSDYATVCRPERDTTNPAGHRDLLKRNFFTLYLSKAEYSV